MEDDVSDNMFSVYNILLFLLNCDIAYANDVSDFMHNRRWNSCWADTVFFANEISQE